GIAEEFQEDGGKYLLFLESSENDQFLVPVGGPNGMVQIYNDRVIAEKKVNRSAYEEVFQGAAKNPTKHDDSLKGHVGHQSKKKGMSQGDHHESNQAQESNFLLMI